jgi:hypothetical protein
LQPLWRGYAAVVGGIKIIAVSASDRRGSTVIAWRVISTGRGSADGSSTNGSSPDAYRHSAAYGCTTVDATAINTTVVNANATTPTPLRYANASLEIVARHATPTITDAESEIRVRRDMMMSFVWGDAAKQFQCDA